MADAEEGFTFVDKRRVADQAAAVEDPSAVVTATSEQVAPEDSVDAELDADGDQGDDLGLDEPGDVYSLLVYFLRMTAAQAWLYLGLIADPKTGETRADLAQAKVAIDTAGDLVGRLESAPDDIIPANARRDMRNLLNDLRLNYVAQRDRVATVS